MLGCVGLFDCGIVMFVVVLVSLLLGLWLVIVIGCCLGLINTVVVFEFLGLILG